jgi:hypothetical protein
MGVVPELDEPLVVGEQRNKNRDALQRQHGCTLVADRDDSTRGNEQRTQRSDQNRFNKTTTFELAPGAPARFLFVTEDGTISGWNPLVDPTHAVIKAMNPDAVYKGAAIVFGGGKWFLYVANFV